MWVGGRDWPDLRGHRCLCYGLCATLSVRIRTSGLLVLTQPQPLAQAHSLVRSRTRQPPWENKAWALHEVVELWEVLNPYGLRFFDGKYRPPIAEPLGPWLTRVDPPALKNQKKFPSAKNETHQRGRRSVLPAHPPNHVWGGGQGFALIFVPAGGGSPLDPSPTPLDPLPRSQ